MGVSAALVLAACGGGGAGSGQGPGTTQGSQAGFNAASTSVVNPSDKKGGTLTFANSGDWDTLTPVRPTTPTRGTLRGSMVAR